jgi:hypothetical protein
VALPVVAVLCLGGCETLDRLRQDMMPKQPEKAAEAKPAGQPMTQTATFPAPPVKPPSPGAPRGAPGEPAGKLQPSQLVGLEQDQAQSLLGPATAVRDVPPATVWEYRVKGCSLDLFFYMDVAEKRYRSLAYDLKSTQNQGEGAAERCLSVIESEHHGS